jgi:hypothetical protein
MGPANDAGASTDCVSQAGPKEEDMQQLSLSRTQPSFLVYAARNSVKQKKTALTPTCFLEPAVFTADRSIS